MELRPRPNSPGGAYIALERWTESLACELGLCRAETVMLALAGLAPDERLVSARFSQLYAMNRHHHRPAPGVRDAPLKFALGFASTWTGLPEHRAKIALRTLRERDVIRCVGRHRRANLYVPGDGSQRVMFDPEPEQPYPPGGQQ